MQPDPIADLTKVESPLSAEVCEHLQHLSDNLHVLLAEKQLRATVDVLPLYDMAVLHHSAESRLVERCFFIYSGLANGYVWAEEDNPIRRLPASVAVPLVQLAEQVERPPIIDYACTALGNFRRVDQDGPLSADNMTTLQSFTPLDDEVWFNVIHADIEARAAEALTGCFVATEAVRVGDFGPMEVAFGRIQTSLQEMLATFRRMPQRCSPDTYYHTLRPFLFGFDGVVYEGVEKFGDKPQTVIGETGAQSSVIPAIQTFLGLHHAQGGLSEHLALMRSYMPKPHRDLIAAIDQTLIRDTVQTAADPALTDAYNACLEAVADFRSQHLHFAHAYIASKVKNPLGTGGTDFMQWLKKLRDETTAQLLVN